MRRLGLLIMSVFYLLYHGPLFALEEENGKSNKLKFSGYLDTSYNYLVRSNEFTSETLNRAFDIEPNGFTLQQAAITLAKQPACGLGGVINLIVGRDANIIAPYGWNPYFGSQTLALVWPQLYLQAAYGPLTIIGGELLTLAGAEVIDATEGPQFSHSLLFTFAEPFTHLGIRATYAITDKLNLVLGLNNGWDSIRDTSRRKTIEASVDYTYSPAFSFTAVGYSGGQRAEDRTDTGPESIRGLLDLIATIHATDKLDLVANYDYGNQTLAALPEDTIAEGVWQGFAAGAKYQMNDHWYVAGRGEIFDDRNGYRTGVTQTLEEVTFTLGYAPIKCLLFRLETRHDFSNVESFLDRNGESANRNQQSYALEGVAKFD